MVGKDNAGKIVVTQIQAKKILIRCYINTMAIPCWCKITQKGAGLSHPCLSVSWILGSEFIYVHVCN